MRKPGTIRTTPRGGHGTVSTRLRRIMLKRVWLPRVIYEGLPVVYICSGLVALAAALYQPDWTWILPWAIVFGFAALHLGVGIAALRHKFRRGKQRSAAEKPGCGHDDSH